MIGDGAVGLCGVIAAKRLGAEQIIILGRHPDRIALAKDFGATDVVGERGEEAVESVRKITGGTGVHSVLECVGSEQSMLTAIGMGRPGAAVGHVGVPHYATIPGKIHPGRVFDRVVKLNQVPDGYRAMNERESIKVLVTP